MPISQRHAKRDFLMLLPNAFSSSSPASPRLRLGAALAFILVGGALVSPPKADFIHINSLLSNNNGGTIIGTPLAGNWAASQFQVASGTPLSTISQISLALEQGGSGATDLGLLSVSIYSDNAATPYLDLTPGASAFLNGGTLTGPATVAFSTNTPFTLAANSIYWLVLKSSAEFTAADSARWTYNEDSASAPLVGIDGQINNITKATFDSGAKWNTAANRFYRFAISVPEPSTYLMGAVATLFLGAMAWRKSGSKA